MASNENDQAHKPQLLSCAEPATYAANSRKSLLSRRWFLLTVQGGLLIGVGILVLAHSDFRRQAIVDISAQPPSM